MPEIHEEPKPDVDGVRSKVNAIIGERTLKQTAVAREAGLSPSLLSAFLAGNYRGDNDATARSLSAWLDNVARRDGLPAALKGRHPFTETDIAASIMVGLEWSQSSADLVAIIGEPGIGKTEALRQFAKTGVSVWTAEMRADTSKQVAALEEVCSAVNVAPSASPSSMSRTVIRHLRGTGGCLLIDEAQHLQPAALNSLRAIHDAAGIGLVLCGNPKLWERICEMPELRSRIGRRVVLRKPIKSDVQAVMGALGIEGGREADFLHTIAQYPGGLRCVVKTARQGALAAWRSGSRIVSIEYLAAAWSELSTEDGL